MLSLLVTAMSVVRLVTLLGSVPRRRTGATTEATAEVAVAVVANVVAVVVAVEAVAGAAVVAVPRSNVPTAIRRAM